MTDDWFNHLKRILDDGGYRRTSQKGKGGPSQQSNSRPGGAGTQRAAERTRAALDTYQRACQRAGKNSGLIVDWNYYLDVPKRTKWAPPWMGGDLGRPNNAKTWIPHGVSHMASEGIQAGEIIAWRAWYWDAKRKRLRSIFVDYEWPINGPAIGQPGRGYGIHAFKTLPRVLNEYFGCLEDLFVGEVALWGDVVEFQSGYTAEYAKVYRLYPFDFTKELTNDVLKLYELDDGNI